MEAIEQVLRQSVGQATAIALAALGETLVESAGVLNLSLEGTILSAAFAGALGAEWSGSAEVGLLCGVGAAVAFSALFGLVVLWLRADEVIAGTAMNLLAGGTTAVFWRAAHGLGGAPTAVPHFSTIRVPLLADIPIIGPALFEHHLFTFAAYAAAPLVWVWLRRSGAGLRLRACGESPAAASAMGIPVRRTRFLAILACGALAGLAGVCLSLAQTSTFVDGMSAGRGFVAIALVIFGAHHPLGAAAAALLFGGALALQFRFQAAGWDVPPELFRSWPYVLSLVFLAGFAGKRRAPAALGRGLP
jgi:simple sugar transport system permease protein